MSEVIGSTILLAEDSYNDEAWFKLVMRKSLLANPLVVVRGGDEAMAYLNGEGIYDDREKYPFPGILFLDLRMPRVDGFEVLEWIQTQPHLGENLLKVVLSHFGATPEVARAYKLGANTFLSKPITERDFENLVRHFRSYWVRPHAAPCVV